MLLDQADEPVFLTKRWQGIDFTLCFTELVSEVYGRTVSLKPLLSDHWHIALSLTGEQEENVI
jgi:hypothetical protein